MKRQKECAKGPAIEPLDFCENLPERIRISFGSAVILGLVNAKLNVAPTTTYLMTYSQKKCTANCAFCPQARTSGAGADTLSRVTWPARQTQEVLAAIVDAVADGETKRVCIQALNYPRIFNDACALIRAINRSSRVPISVSCQPASDADLYRLASAGAERIGIPLDAATEEIFNATKGVNVGGPYTWGKQWHLLAHASEVFGRFRVSTHLIVGLGETEEEMTRTIQKCVDMSVLPALFAFTPILGTALASQAPPPVERYRRIQVARHLMSHGTAKCGQMDFDDKGSITGFGIEEKRLLQALGKGEPFLTSGCPSCNRPFYNERPSGPIYNFPRELTSTELSTIKRQLCLE
jgi:biotin synthase-related radical SAM superfamily protein